MEEADKEYHLDVPFNIAPHQSVYEVGDTVSLTLLLDEYYANNIDEGFPIRNNVLLDLVLFISDSSGYKRTHEEFYTIDSFDFFIDSNARRVFHTSGSSNIVFRSAYNEQKQTLQSNILFVPQKKGFYALQLVRNIISEDQFYADLKEGCGLEKFALDISINKNIQKGQNKHLVEWDTSLIHKFGGWYQKTPVDEILNKKNIYYFSVE